MARGITVTNYLVDGNPEGVVFAYVSNWSGQAIKIPRNIFPDSRNLDEINKPGVYMLFGQNSDNPDDKLVYVGEANNISERLMAHMRDLDKSFFESIVCFTSKDDTLSVSHTKYLEGKLIKQVNNSVDYTCVNGKAGNAVNLSKMVRDEVESFYDNMKIVLPTIGYNILHENIPASKGTDLLFLNVGKIKAKAKLTTNGLEVMSGSLYNNTATNALSGSYVSLRRMLEEKKIVIEENGQYRFERNYEFSSPSAAGAVILGYSVNGRSFWKDKNGKSINDIESEQLETV